MIFDADVTVQDRFHGCVRYSRVTGGSVLPQAYRVAVDVPLRLVSRNRRDPASEQHQADTLDQLLDMVRSKTLLV